MDQFNQLKKGNWDVADAFDLDKASDLLDDKTSERIMADIRKQLGPEGLSKHKPIVSGPGVGPGGIPISSGRQAIHKKPIWDSSVPNMPARSGSKGAAGSSPAGRIGPKDADLQSSMIKRLQQLENLNAALKKELAEKNQKNFALIEENENLKLLTSKKAQEELVQLKKERDEHKKQNDEMKKFLKSESK